MLCEHEVAGLIAGASGKVYVLYCSRYRFCFVFGSGLQLHYYAPTVEGARGQNKTTSGTPRAAKVQGANIVSGGSGRAGAGRGPGGVGDCRRCAAPRARGERMNFTPSQCCTPAAYTSCIHRSDTLSLT